VSDPIDTRGVLVALGADPNDYDRVIPLLDRLLTALRDGETIVFYGNASSPSGATMMKLAEPGDWGTLITTDLPVCTENLIRVDEGMESPKLAK
jgi:hypothetical protein